MKRSLQMAAIINITIVIITIEQSGWGGVKK